MAITKQTTVLTMRIKCIAVGKNMPEWVNAAVAEYAKRLQHEWPFEIIEIPNVKRSKNHTPEQDMAKEAMAITQHIQPRDTVIVTAVNGKSLSTEAFAAQCANWDASGQPLSIIIGGPDGIAPSLFQHADFTWSLSPLTLPHPIVRILIAEQLYRASSVLKGHPYHRG